MLPNWLSLYMFRKQRKHLHSSHTNAPIIPFDLSLVIQMSQLLLLSGPRATRTKSRASIPKLHGPVLALKTGLQEEIGLQSSRARLPETIPKKLPEDGATLLRLCNSFQMLQQTVKTLHYLIHLEGSPPVSRLFAAAPVMSQLGLWSCYHPSSKSNTSIFHYCDRFLQSAKTQIAQIPNEELRLSA